MTLENLRILLVEDDELFRLGLRVRLQQEPGFAIAAEAEDGETALEIANQYPIDVVLLDVGLPGLGGVETCRQLRQAYPHLPILILTSYSQSTLIARLIEAGANGYCLKGIPAEVLILALRSVAAGASWWDKIATHEIQTWSSQHLTSPSLPRSRSLPALTKREQEILAAIARGKNNQEIAEELYISPGTVRVHIHAILQKLGVKDRKAAAQLYSTHLEN
jgi:two-component system, NarL family, response regulator